jgi:hypothetical protein
VFRDAAVRFLLAAWELIMGQNLRMSLEPPVDTGVDSGIEVQSLAMDEVPSLEGDSEAVTLVPSLEAEGEGETVAVSSPEGESEATANSIGLLLQRGASSAIDEIGRLTAELQAVRRLLQSEATRIEHQIIEYANLNQSTMQTTKIIAEHLASLRTAPGEPSDKPQPDPIPQEDDRVPVHQPPAGRRGDSRFHGPAHATGGSSAGVRPPGSIVSV